MGEKNPHYKHGLTDKATFCMDCGEQTSGFRSVRCRSCSSKGILNSNWKGGIDPNVHKIRCSKEYKLWRTSVFLRDGFICQACGGNKSKILQAHHILPMSKFPHLTFDISNGKTLCIFCHQKVHPNMNLFKGKFKELINE